MKVRLDVVAVPGAPEHTPTRKQLLDRVDGIVLVVDCTPERLDANLEAFDELRRSLADYGRSLDDVPLVVEYNKRDCADEFTLEELHRKLDLRGAPVFEAVASAGKGILPVLTTISKHVIRSLRDQGMAAMASAAPAAPAPTPAAAPPAAGREAAQDPELEPVLEPVLEPETLPEPEPIEAQTVERGLFEEERDPGRAQTVAALAAETEALLEDSWGEVTAPVGGIAPGERVGELRIASIGTPAKAGERALVVPLVLRDADGRTLRVRLAVTLDLLPHAGED